ncbi:AMP deaminase [Irineochytrium annulatum]|nr:AMP deaminase [Irineochytrium annulatum]
MASVTGTAVTSEGVAAFARADVHEESPDELSSELKKIFDVMQRCLELRKKYMQLDKASLQCPGDNPKDDDSWVIYPKPPKPAYPYGENNPTIPEPNEEFDIRKCEIPPKHEV